MMDDRRYRSVAIYAVIDIIFGAYHLVLWRTMGGKDFPSISDYATYYRYLRLPFGGAR
jgi:hypothetical protein